MESDWGRHPSVKSEASSYNKFPMRKDVESVLAQVAVILQEATGHEEKESVQGDTDNRCKNPFCGKALPNVYASYCEERTCQQYRAVKLQCLVNANAVAVEDIEANGRTDSFLVLGGTGTAAGEQEYTETAKKSAGAEEPFVIPRRKRPRTNATVQNGDQQSSNPKLPRLRPRMGFNEVLAHFEPHVPALAVSSQMKARRVQQASRWSQSRRQFKVALMPRSSQTRSFAGGDHYGRSRNRSIRSGRPTSQTPYQPQLPPYRSTRRETANSGVGRRREFSPRPQEARSDERSSRYRYFSMGANPHAAVRESPGGNSQQHGYISPRESSSGPPQVDRQSGANGNPFDDVVRRPRYDGEREGNRVIVYDDQEGHGRPTSTFASFPTDTFSCRDEPNVERAFDPIPPARLPPETSTDQFTSSDNDVDCEASFSIHDSFLPRLLSRFIMDLPKKMEPVMNSTKRARKLRWYLEYTQRIERIGSPHVHIQIESKAVVVLVGNRVWLKLKGPSTVILLEKTIQTMRDHAISWQEIKSEVKQSLDLYRSRQGEAVDMANVFMRAWNNVKDSRHGKLLPRGVNYFCGSRLHHWSFVLGKVEIGSGSHDDKREAFRLAAANAADFLLGLNDGQNDHTWRPPRVQRVNPSEDDSDCELLYVKDPTDEAAAAAATASAFELSSSSKSSSADVSDTEALPKTERGGNGESTVIVISDSEEDDPASGTFLPPQAAVNAASATATPMSQCSMCEVIRMRKPDSAGCRRCQLVSKHTKSSLGASASNTSAKSDVGPGMWRAFS
ncbi:hypothetical protein DVH05_013276 [Phytophthora capsici]|nr:hypothetical protein DVH05_013276 [Phytophthora capsici]